MTKLDIQMILMKKVFEVLLYLSLLAGGLLFCSENIKEYQLSATAYSASKKPLTLSDLPTSVTCLNVSEILAQGDEFVYGENWLAHYRVSYKQDKHSNLSIKGKDVSMSKPLILNGKIISLFGLEIHLSEVQSEIFFTEYKCYKITPYWKGHFDHFDILKFQSEVAFRPINFTFESEKEHINVLTEHYGVSSEANAYGRPGGRYFDGAYIGGPQN